MDKNCIVEFFDEWAERWDAGMVRNEKVIGTILDNCRVRENLHRNTGPLSYEVEYWLPVWITSEFEAGQGQERAAAVSGPG